MIFSFLFVVSAGFWPAGAYDDFRYFFGGDIEAAGERAEFELYKQFPPDQGQAVPYWPLRLEAGCVLKAVARAKGIALRADVEEPRIYFGSQTPLDVFQDTVERVYGLRPRVFHNIYVDTDNIIFLLDDSAIYRNGRTAEDSLAHEYVHFLQVRYEGATRDSNRRVLELSAKRYQKWFRETYMSGEEPKDPCAEPASLPVRGVSR